MIILKTASASHMDSQQTNQLTNFLKEKNSKVLFWREDKFRLKKFTRKMTIKIVLVH